MLQPFGFMSTVDLWPGVLPVTPAEMHRLMTEHQDRMREAVSRHLLWPGGSSPRDTCRIEIVQSADGTVLSVDIVECASSSLADAVIQAIGRTPMPPPLQFPHDPPLARCTTWLEFSPLENLS